jgi:thymine-DNA glycosylase
MKNGVPILLAKIALYQPRIVCFVGKQIGEVFLKEACGLTGTTLSDVPSASSVLQVTLEEGTSSGRSRKNTVRKTTAKTRKAAKPTFKWGFQPFKAVHPNSSPVKETLFFIMPSSSARVIGYQVCFGTCFSGRISN